MSTLRRLRLGLVVCLSLALPARGGAQTAHTKWYLAEGNAGYFDEEILAVNPTAQDAVGVIHVCATAPRRRTSRSRCRSSIGQR